MSDLPRDLATDPELPAALRERLASGDVPEEIRLDAGGRWLFRGAPVAHPRVVRLFHRSLVRTARGHWLLRVGRYTYPVVVEDTARFVLHLARHDGALRLLLADGTSAPFDPSAVLTDGLTFFGTPVGDAGEIARFVGQAALDLAELIELRDGRPGVQTAAGWWPLRPRR